MPVVSRQPRQSSPEEAAALARRLFGLEGAASVLVGERDLNFVLTTDSGERFVLKISSESDEHEALVAQNLAMEEVARREPALRVPRVCRTVDGEEIATLETAGSKTPQLVRLLAFVPGTPLAELERHTPSLLRQVGSFMARLDAALEGFSHPGAQRKIQWDLTHAVETVARHLEHIQGAEERALLHRFLLQFDAEVTPNIDKLRPGVIHNDANDYNVLLDDVEANEPTVSGIIDFGDMVEARTVFDLAVAAAYASLSKPDPVEAAAHVIAGYHEVGALIDAEIDALFALIAGRLCLSVAISAYQKQRDPDNAYLTISEEAAWATLKQLAGVDPRSANERFRVACGKSPDLASSPGMTRDEILQTRREHISGAFSVSYGEPLHIVRGSGQYLFDTAGRAYLDLVNNVCHVGHCHPGVVEAAQQQIAILNTNTRYLHENLVTYAERLCATFPDPLSVCFFVCSGSEANELALRLAHTHTRRTDIIVVDGAYHGNTSALIDISPYKHDGPGGRGAPPHVHVVPMPDCYRGAHRDPESAGALYAASVGEAIEAARADGREVSTFISESLLSCAGQIELPGGYLEAAYAYARAAGAVCIADEVQVGFGRVGTHFWGFETQGVVPDIVTLGKPMGNGHPVAAVVTTPEIARSFENGMEYFNTFGGNPVSCAIGLAVLDAIERDGLQRNALDVGERMEDGLARLKERHAVIGDVRGRGLFLGIELVRDRETHEPAADLTRHVVEHMKERGFLISLDGPLHNVLKIKPPLVFSQANADLTVDAIDLILTECAEAEPR